MLELTVFTARVGRVMASPNDKLEGDNPYATKYFACLTFRYMSNCLTWCLCRVFSIDIDSSELI